MKKIRKKTSKWNKNWVNEMRQWHALEDHAYDFFHIGLSSSVKHRDESTLNSDAAYVFHNPYAKNTSQSYVVMRAKTGAWYGTSSEWYNYFARSLADAISIGGQLGTSEMVLLDIPIQGWTP